MTIAFSGPCVADQPPFFVNSDTQGTLRLDTSALQLVKGMTGCAVNVQVRHETNGAVDPAYASGGDGVEGLQARSFATTLE